MKRFILFSSSILTAFSLTALPAAAVPELLSANLSTPGTQRSLTLPVAAGNSGVISLGTSVDPETGNAVQGYAIVHYKTGEERSANAKAKPGGTACYGYLASGAKWKTVEPWVVNPANIDGLDGDFVFANLGVDITKWEDATDGIVGNAAGTNVLGDGAVTTDVLAADTASPDGINEVLFADVSSLGAIGVTIVWGYFSGPPQTRQLFEWDQVYDDVDFDWSAFGEAGKMDFENIATHELGHSVGLADLYTTGCGEETMYGYAIEGETKKQTLNAGDIAGINKLY